MSRGPRALFAVLLAVLLAGCATTDDGPSVSTERLPRAETVVIPRRPGRPQVQVTEQDFRAAMRTLLREVRVPARYGAGVSRLQVVPAGWEPLEHAQLALARDYLAWCERRHQPGDCLELLRGRPMLDADAKYKLAFKFALGAQWDGLTEELRASVDPVKVQSFLLAAMVAYMAAIALPEPTTKVLAAGLTLVLTAYLGAETLWNLVVGWVRMVQEAKQARTFSELRAAGERYGHAMGAQTARVLVMVATAAMAEPGLGSRWPTLPGGPQASALLASETGGVGLAAVGSVASAAVTEAGVVVVLVPAVEGARVTGVAMAAGKAPGEGPAPKKRPGEWKKARTPVKGRAGQYQQQITGHPPDEAYMVNGVEFDGYDPNADVLLHAENGGGVLLDAKGKGYEKFFNEDLSPKPWFKESGRKKLVEQANRQLGAAPDGIRIRWHVAERRAAEAIQKLLSDSGYGEIEVVHTPMQP